MFCLGEKNRQNLELNYASFHGKLKSNGKPCCFGVVEFLKYRGEWVLYSHKVRSYEILHVFGFTERSYS